MGEFSRQVDDDAAFAIPAHSADKLNDSAKRLAQQSPFYVKKRRYQSIPASISPVN
jgi:hypothetical protein